MLIKFNSIYRALTTIDSKGQKCKFLKTQDGGRFHKYEAILTKF